MENNRLSAIKRFGRTGMSLLLIVGMTPFTTACDETDVAVGVAVAAAGAAVISNSHRHRHHHDRYWHRYDRWERRHRHHHRRNHRHHRHHRGGYYYHSAVLNAEATEDQPSIIHETTLQDYMQTYKLSEQGALKLQNAIENADTGSLAGLETLGLEQSDIESMMQTYRVPENANVKALGDNLGLNLAETKSMLHKMIMFARQLRLKACKTDRTHYDSICN